MNKVVLKLGTIVIQAGFNPRKLFFAILTLPNYIGRYVRCLFTSRWKVRFMPILADRMAPAGSTKGHYFHQDLWAARKIYKRRPKVHLDVGSRIDGFIAHLLTFMDVMVLDIRSLKSDIAGLTFIQSDITRDVGKLANSFDSVSSLSAVEHFGLGRYGDDFDLDGHVKGLASMSKILIKNGTLLLSVPIGTERIEFDAHRVFSPATILEIGESLQLRLISFSYIDDDSMLHEGVDLKSLPELYFGCGLFEFVKN